MAKALQSINYDDDVRAYLLEGTVVANTIVKSGSTAGTAVAAGAAETKGILGIALQGGTSGQTIDVVDGAGSIVPVVAGAAFAIGDPITADASGQGITAAPGAGATVDSVGRAMQASTALGDVCGVRVAPTRVTNGGT